MVGKWDGSFKDKTKDCSDLCLFYDHVFIPGRNRLHPCYMSGDEITIDEERCYCGIAWKRLSLTDKPRKCQYNLPKKPVLTLASNLEPTDNYKNISLQDDNHVNRNSRQTKLR